MSEAQQAQEWQGRIDELIPFYRNYYKDQLGELAEQYPRDSRSLYIDWSDIYTALPDFADDLLHYPHGGDDPRADPLRDLHEALYNVDLPLPEDFRRDSFADAHVRVVLPDNKRLGIGEIRSRHKNRYVAIYGQIERVTQQTERMTEGVYTCQKCGRDVNVLQPVDELNEPDSCPGKGCSGKPNFELDANKSKTVDLRKLKLKQPPEDADGDGKTLRVYLEDDLAFSDGDRTLPGMAGERATIHGILKRDLSPMRGRSAKPEFGTYLEGHALEFESSLSQDIDVSEHQEEIQAVAQADDTLQQLVESFAPAVAGGDRMDAIKRACVLYLFGGYRKDPDDGASQRGDLHLLLVGDPATGKTQLLNYIERVSPRCERLSGTDSTGVGLTAAATQDEFADGNWVLKPGLLPRASGGHAIVDELDKMDGADNLHEALEDQRIHVAKAGMNATLKTEAGLVAASNPDMGRFDSYTDFVEQIDIDPALFSRFDIIHTLHDRQDEIKDEQVARAALDNWQRASNDDEDTVSVPLDVDAFRAYIAKAKDIEPSLSDSAKESLVDFYVSERAREWGNDDEDTVPMTARTVPAGARLAEANARANLRDVVTQQDVRVAINVIKTMMVDVYLNEKGEMDVDRVESPTNYTQQQEIKTITEYVREHPKCTRDEIGDALDIDESTVEHKVSKLKNQGKLYEPKTGKLQVT